MTQGVTKIDLGYIAGVLDGEGTLVIAGCKRKENRNLAYRGYMAITNTNIPLLEHIQSRVGGLIHPQTKVYRGEICPCYVLNFSVNQTRAVLPKLLPYLVAKRDQAEVLLSFLERQAANASAPISDELLGFYEECRVKIKRLKKIRYSYEKKSVSEIRNCAQCGSSFNWSSSTPMRIYCSVECKKRVHWTRSNGRISDGIPAWNALPGSNRFLRTTNG